MSRSFCGIRQERIKMPTTYAHDLFGQKVYRQMPEEVKKVIRENGELYRIGLHGPTSSFIILFSKIMSAALDTGCIRKKPEPFSSRE